MARLFLWTIPTLLLTVILCYLVVGVRQSVERLIVTTAQEVQIVNPSYTASWKDAEGITHTVSTPRNGATEPVAEWAARHAENVAALKALFPPVS